MALGGGGGGTPILGALPTITACLLLHRSTNRMIHVSEAKSPNNSERNAQKCKFTSAPHQDTCTALEYYGE